MALSNHERIGKGLDALKRGLSNYVLREMRECYGESFPSVVERQLDGGQYSQIREGVSNGQDFRKLADVAVYLKLMWGSYNDAFKPTLGFAGRNYISELREVRNQWAHQQPFTLDDANRALDTMGRLLRAVSAGEEADEVQRHYRAIQRQQFEADQRRETKRVSEIPSSGGLRPWREVVDPHPDVASGRYQEAEFAADLAEVLRGTADEEYQKPKEFFRRTYLTEGMVALLANAIQRVDGQGGDPVVQLQTVFGGGKTHSMLALYHLFGEDLYLRDVPDGEKISEAAGLDFLPRAERAVLVGTDLDPNRERQHSEATTRTLWGEMAYQIGGAEAYALVADADASGTAPGAGTIKELFDEYGPAIVLIDELVAYMRNIYGKSQDPVAGSFDSNITFIQNLTEAAKRSESSLVLVSIPVSERVGEAERSDIETGGETGKLVVERLEHVIGRLESIWKPVAASESFEIVRRRLFSGEINTPARDAVVEAFSHMYRDNRRDYPSESAEGDYERRLRSSYPIHPELFDRLYQDWSTLEKFQRTRGVLRLMAAVIHELWSRGDGSLLIMPGSLPLDAPKVRNQFLRYLPDGWNAVVDTDVDGPDSRPESLDGEHPRLGRIAASRRVARTVFVGSAPSVSEQQVRGVEEGRMRLGCVQPGESSSVFVDALQRLSGQLTYLYYDAGRYWYDTRTNVNREAADRAQQQRAEDVVDEMVRRLRSERDRGQFAAVHVCPSSSSDVPDEKEARLAILQPQSTYKRSDEDNAALEAAKDTLFNRGNSPRKYRNTLVFLAPDRDRTPALEESVRQYLAWKSILDDEERLNLDTYSRRQAQNRLQSTDDTVDGQLREAYRWLLYPTQEGTQPLEWTATGLNGGDQPFAARASRKLISDEELITSWSPKLVKMWLDRHLWKESDHLSLKQLWEYLATYLYLPRLKNENVLIEAVKEGVQSRDFFGYAAAVSESGRYEGLKFGESVASVHLDAESVLVKPEVARRQQEADAEKEDEPGIGGAGSGKGPGSENGYTEPGSDPHSGGVVREPPKARRFYGSIELDPVRMGSNAGQINEAIVQHLSSLMGSDVEVTLEIRAEVPDGASEQVVRTVNENCQTLKFKDFGFESY